MTPLFSCFSLSLYSCSITLCLYVWGVFNAVSAVERNFHFSKSEDPLSLSELSQSACFKRVLVPYFLLKDYSLPGSAFASPSQCEHLNQQKNQENQIRTSLTNSIDDHRLPKSVLPKHYDLKLCPDLRKAFRFSGSVQIELQVVESTSMIVLNILNLKLGSLALWYETSFDLFDEIFGKRRQNKTGTRRDNNKFKDFQKYKDQKFNFTNASPENTAAVVTENEISKRKTRKLRVHLPISSVNIDETLQRLIIRTEQDLKINYTYKLEIYFFGNASHDLTGLYTTFHFDSDRMLRYSLATQFQASAARKVFPCFDEPSFRSEFTIGLCRDKSHKSISNMPKRKTVPDRRHRDMVWDYFERSVPMATYLVAFAILDDFDYVQCNHSSVPFKVWGPTDALNSAELACDQGPKLLQFFEDYFQYPYPLPKMDFLALPQFFALGMENWGLVTFLWNRLLVDKESAMEETQQESLETISHEIAHQWFGNLVTPSWWSEIWLNEGFATFLSLIGLDYVRPSWQKTKDYVITVLHSVLGHDSMESSHPILMNVKEPKEFFSIFDSISYGKGCFLVRMLMHIISKRAFQNGLQNYLRKLEFQSASDDDLWLYMTQAGHNAGTLDSNLSIAEVMDTWVIQEGYPVVSVVKTLDGTIELKQKRHYQEIDEAEAALKIEVINHPKWWIPVSMATELNPNMNDTSPKFWMNSDVHVIHLEEPLEPHHWFILNVQQTGFFRVNYERDNWMLIARQLMRDHSVFDDITRAQLIDDSFALAFADSVDFEIPFSMIAYLSKEDSPHVLSAALENLKLLLALFSDDAVFGEIKDMILSVMATHYPKNGIVDRPPEKYFEKRTTNLLINTICRVYEPCIVESKLIYEAWKANSSNFGVVDKDIFGTILCTIVSEGGEPEWEIIWDAYYKNLINENSSLLLALSCTRHLWLNSRLLMRLSGSGTSFTFSMSLPTALGFVAQNPTSLELAWEFLRMIWPTVVETGEDQMFFDAVVPHLKTKGQYKELIEFVASSVDGVTTMHESYVTEVVKNVKRKIDFQYRNYVEFFEWFTGKGQLNKEV